MKGFKWHCTWFSLSLSLGVTVFILITFFDQTHHASRRLVYLISSTSPYHPISESHRFTRVQPTVRDVYSLPYPQHMYAMEHDFHIIISGFNARADISLCIDSLLRQEYPNLKIWVYGHASVDIASFLIDTRYSMEPKIAFMDCSGIGDENMHLWALRRVREVATPNDIVIVMDAEHYMTLDNAITQINRIFVDTKCWVIHGSYLKASDDKIKLMHSDYANDMQLVASSDSIWTFKAFLIDHITQDDFFSEDLDSSSRALRMRYILHFIELSGTSRVQYLATPVHSHKESQLQSDMTQAAVTRNMAELRNSAHFEPLKEDIHVFLCIWGRKHLLQKTLQSLTHRQTISDRIHVHIWNNNPSIKAHADLTIPLISRKIDIVHSDVNLYSYARFLHIKKIMSTHHIDYAIIVDDDQLFPSDYIERLYADRLPKVYRSWWGRQFHGQSYFDGIPHGSVLIKGSLPELVDFDYAGPGGCVIDSGVFMMQATYMIPKQFISLDDLWLSYVVNVAGWKAKRTFVRPRFIQDRKTTSVALWSTLKTEKDDFLNFLRVGGWQV